MALKKIIQYHKAFFEQGPGPLFYLLWAVMLSLLFYGNYYGGWGETQIEAYPQGFTRYGIFVLYNALPYGITISLYHIFTKKPDEQYEVKRLIIPACIGLIFLGAYTDFYFHRFLVPDDLPYPLYYFTVKCFANGGKAVAAFVVLGIILWLLRVNDSRFYGLFETKADLKPYFIMLALMLPLIIIASFQTDFLDYYPRYRSSAAAEYWGIPFSITQLAFQLCYGLDFVAVELIFRGLFVVLMVRYAGKAAVYSMTTVYFMLHFGKPMGEAVSSIFGGFILGVIAMYSRSILGGVIIHLGVAWLMEFTAWIQHIYKGTVFN